MFTITGPQADLLSVCEQMGLLDALHFGRSALIKINLAGTPQPGHPRTDAGLLTTLIRLITASGAHCAIAECTDGHIAENLRAIGLGGMLEQTQVSFVDLDLEEADEIVINGEAHYIPRCLRNYDVRIALPAATKRLGMIFSNNVKLFVGAVPRRYYQLSEASSWRPRIHENLHRSVANIFQAVQSYSPFQYFVNGGIAMHEDRGEFLLPGVLVGNDAVELDDYLLREIFQIEEPEYLRLLKAVVVEQLKERSNNVTAC